MTWLRPSASRNSSTDSSTSSREWPWAPAFIRTDPPNVAGMATPNSRPARPWDRATPASAGSGIEPPADSRSPSRAAHRNARPSRRTRPGKPRSETNTFEPLPRTTTGRDVLRTARPAASRSSRDSASRNMAARPPRRNDVSGARGKSRRTRSPAISRSNPSASVRAAGVAASPSTERSPLHDGHGFLPNHGDVSGSQGEHQIARADLPSQERRHIDPPRQVHGPLARSGLHQRVDEQLAGDPGDGKLAGPIDIGDHHDVRAGQALPQPSPHRLRP